MCESQDDIIGVAVQRLLPGQFGGQGHFLAAILMLESLNTVDTSILMCAKVIASQARRHSFLPELPAADYASIVLALGISD